MDEQKFKHFKDLRKMPVQVNPCTTCPFAGSDPLPLDPKSYLNYLMNLINGTGQHLCHSVNNTNICRGGRQIQLQFLYNRGLIESPTDEAFNKAITQYVFPHELESHSGSTQSNSAQ
ncbi:DUF687 domain-containing protein [Laspinema olomoucense]|uniref:DUF687 domain-containing protein n=1 Tax=Laspinema olomoucense TaxID=3231600 RepID=UPI0021BB090C|nr:DUF687 domain-containing protein [Laspinema sp. D3d]MCT7971247.1 DUF687 domain-containing protein [Laspinema sp. D3d]